MTNTKINILQESIVENPDNPFAYFALAREYQKLNDKNRSREQFHHLIHHFPEYGATYYHYAIFLLDEEETDEARKIIAKGLDVLHKNKDIHLHNELIALRDQYFDPE